MNYLAFYKKARTYPLFRVEDIFKWFPEARRQNVLNQLNLWVKRGYIERIARGVYNLADYEIGDSFILANFLYGPSYVTLESALNAYGIIPDIPFATTSVAMPKTKTFRTAKYGSFFYHHIKPELFFGFKIVRGSPPLHSHYTYRIAIPEKALFDYLYLRAGKQANIDGFWEELRLSLPKNFHFSKLRQWSKLVSLQKKTFHILINSFLQKHAK